MDGSPPIEAATETHCCSSSKATHRGDQELWYPGYDWEENSCFCEIPRQG